MNPQAENATPASGKDAGVKDATGAENAAPMVAPATRAVNPDEGRNPGKTFIMVSPCDEGIAPYEDFPDETFLNAVFGDLPEECPCFHLWTCSADKSEKRTYWCRTVADAVAAAQRAADRHVYYGIGLSTKPGEPTERVKTDTVAGIVGLVADIDIGTHDNGKHYPPDQEAAEALIGGIGLLPTAVIHSGGGLQVVWLFKEVWTFDTDAERDEAAALSEGWGKHIAEVAERHGYQVDAVHDLARLMRLPGTWNVKPEYPEPRPVTILRADYTRRFNPSAFADFVPATPEPEPTPARTPTATPAPAAEAPAPRHDLTDEQLLVKAAEAKNGDRFEQLWCGDMTGYPSQSEADLALCNLLAFWTGPDPARIERLFSQSALADRGKWRERADYRQDTIGKALAGRTEFYSPGGRKRTDADQGTEPKAKAKVHTHELAQALLAAGNHFARDAGGRLYAFEDGRYTSDGRRIVESGCKAILEEWGRPDSWSSYRASEVEKYILADAPDLWDRPPVDTLNLANGLLDVETATLRPHDPAFLSPVQIPVAFDPEATCPNWDRFVSEVFPQDAQALAFEIVAWLMLPDTGIQKAVLLLGAGANGKSTYLRAVTSFLGGRQNVVAQSLHRLEQNRFAAARLIGKLANICSDLPSAHLEETTVFKALTGGDGELDVERKGIDPFAAPIYARLVFSANHPPQSRDTSKAFFRRWLVVPFEASFDPDGDRPVKTEVQMDAELCCPAEQSGLLNRALQALAQVRTGTLSEPESCRVAHAEFEAETDPLRVWLDAHIVAGPGMLVRKDELRRRYNQDAQREGRPLLTHHAFTPALRRAYPGITEGKRTIGGTRVKCWLGIGLVDAPVYDVENDESGVGL